MALFPALQKYLAALVLVLIATSSFAGENDPGLSSAFMMHPSKGPTANVSEEIKSCFTDCFTISTRRESTTLESRDMDFNPISEALDEAVAITLSKDGDQVIWSLAPTLSTVSLDPKDVIRNVQVLLRYRF